MKRRFLTFMATRRHLPTLPYGLYSDVGLPPRESSGLRFGRDELPFLR